MSASVVMEASAIQKKKMRIARSLFWRPFPPRCVSAIFGSFLSSIFLWLIYFSSSKQQKAPPLRVVYFECERSNRRFPGESEKRRKMLPLIQRYVSCICHVFLAFLWMYNVVNEVEGITLWPTSSEHIEGPADWIGAVQGSFL
jgi:hypothetical protein